MPLKPLKFLDETLRDGQQTLWATRMKTESMLPIAPVMDEAGYYQICAMAAVSFETAAMYLYENPWERLRLLRQHMPKAKLDFLVRSRNVVGWRPQPNDVVELFLKTIRRIGIDSIKVFDGLLDYRNIEFHLKVGKQLGFQVKSLVSFAVSPAHTDEYMAGKARELVRLGVDAVIQSDPAGVLTPERTRTLIPAVRAAIGDDIELQMTCHATTGLANECYRTAIRAGVDVLWTTSRPLSYKSSHPAVIDVLQIAKEEGRPTGLDEGRLREIDDWFYWVAYREKRPVPEPVKFDPRFYEQYAGHQIPGGMISNMVQQLTDLGLQQRLPEVLEEAARVRAELGYPVMVTPFSQFVGVQATLNVIEGERYRTVPNDIRLYARGYYGRPIVPLDPNVQDRLVGDEPMLDPLEGMDEPILPKVRREHGPFASDEDLLMFLFLNPAALSDFKKKQKPITWDPLRSPLSALIRELSRRDHLKSVQLEHRTLRLSLS
ncbi:MAG TPA: pyruvate carboxylase subunit B [Candidatus Binatia bacterium]|nr:pyruvate carboxylase subunit B [Candidatus Binatia bacterium]